jgi:L-threonylcarbamoyladenylate synthase
MKVFSSFTTEVAELLNKGAVGIIPTDTLYGIVAKLNDKAAIQRIYKIKNRSANKPVGTIIFSDLEQISGYVPEAELLEANKYWPGANSVILNVPSDLSYAHKGFEALAFRIPDNAQLIHLLKKVGPIATTSANVSDEPPVTTIEEAQELFGEKVDFYVDGGDLSERFPSTIFRIDNNGTVESIR